MGDQYVLVVLGEPHRTKLNGFLKEFSGLVLLAKSLEDVLERISCINERKSPPFVLSCFVIETEIRSSVSGSSKQNILCRDLLTESTVALQILLAKGEQAFSDAETIELLPFTSIQKDYLPNMSFIVFEASFPPRLQNKLDAVLLLFTRVLCKSLEKVLLLLECEYQAVVLHDFSAHIVTENHGIEALVKVSQVNNCSIFFIVGYNPEKCSSETVENMKTSIKSKFTDQFSSESFSIDLLDGQHAPLQDPNSQQTVKHGIQESVSSSSQHDTEAPLVAGVVYSSVQHRLPAEKKSQS